MDQIKKWLKDAVRAVGIGVLLTVCVSALLFLAGLFIHHFQLWEALELLRSGLFLLCGLALLMVAGLLIRPKGGEKVERHPGWKRNFHTLSLAPVVALATLVLLGCAFCLDYIIFYLRP